MTKAISTHYLDHYKAAGKWSVVARWAVARCGRNQRDTLCACTTDAGQVTCKACLRLMAKPQEGKR